MGAWGAEWTVEMPSHSFSHFDTVSGWACYQGGAQGTPENARAPSPSSHPLSHMQSLTGLFMHIQVNLLASLSPEGIPSS